MSSQTAEILSELAQLRALVTQAIVPDSHSRPGGDVLPQYFKFPEDIITMTGGHVPEGTIRRWKTDGYLRTIKIGRRSFVTPEAWKWFLKNHIKTLIMKVAFFNIA